MFFFDGHLSRFHYTIHFKMRQLSYASLLSLKNVVSHNKQPKNFEGKGEGRIQIVLLSKINTIWPQCQLFCRLSMMELDSLLFCQVVDRNPFMF